MTRQHLARLLGVMAVLAVVGTSITALSAYARRGGDLAEASLVHAFRGGHVVVGDDAAFEVPARGWTVEDADVSVYYTDRHGVPAVGISGPAVFHDGYCRQKPHRSNRGFAGFDRTTTGSAWQSSRELGRSWTRAVARDAHRRTSAPHSPLRTEEITLADGATAVRSTSRIAMPDAGPCGAPAVEVSVLSLDTGRAVANLVLVRDAGARATLSRRAADRITGTLHLVPR